MKKTLALVLALAMVFSTITVAFAEDTLGADAQICADLGMLKGETGTVDAAYVATAPTRLQAAVMFLRLKGLEAEALAFTGEENFADGNIAWAEGANLLAYLKANPQLGWVGDGVNFNPSAPITAKEYYKVLLETLGYKQTTAEVVGDFTWENVVEFAATVGLSKVASVENFTVNDLAVATVEALKLNVKDTEKTLVATLVEAGKIAEDKAVAAGLMEGAASTVALSAEIDDVYAVGNAVVQVEFDGDVDAAAAGNVANYTIEGLAINAVTVADTDRVILDTAAQEAGKLYSIKIGDKTTQFTGLAKKSDGPEITDVVSEDVEEVVITFDRNIDWATGTDVANYTISGVTVVKAVVDQDEVTLTTEGLKDGEEYTVKCTNLKSVDLVNRKTTSEDFEVDYDVNAPKILGDVVADTNTRVLVTFNEEVDEATAEDIANYAIKVNETDGAALEILSIEWDSDDEDNVEITTEAMDKREEYKITISGIADQRNVPNVMTKSTSKTFDSIAPDEDEPTMAGVTVLSPTKFMVRFEDDSRLDEASVLDVSNYEFECDDTDLNIESIENYDSDTGYFEALFTVEEMENDEQCKLTYVDIMDEYGNSMDEDDVTFYARDDDFTSAQLVSAEAIGENEILLVFDTKDLDEDSAENIANYSIDGGIGTPTDAVFEDDDQPANSVLLTVNDMIEGDAYYTITVDGLKDIAGNELYIVERDVNDDGAWDDEMEFSDAEAINMYVVALSFDEEATYADGANVVLTTEEAYDEADAIVLEAKCTNDDDTVVEFSDYAGGVTLDPEVTYYVYEVNGVTDNAGNALVVEPYEYTFDGSDDEPEYAEFESIEQIDADTVKVVMSRFVVAAEAENNGFDIQVDTGDSIDETVYFRRDAGIVEDDEYSLNLFECLTDEHGIPAADDDDVVIDEVTQVPTAGVTEFDGDDADEDAPSIDEIVANSRTHIEVTFDENVDFTTLDENDFELWNVDLDEEVTIESFAIDGHTVIAGDDNFAQSVIEINLSELLEGRYEYELRMDAGAIADFAGNEVDDDTFTFDGTNLGQYE